MVLPFNSILCVVCQCIAIHYFLINLVCNQCISYLFTVSAFVFYFLLKGHMALILAVFVLGRNGVLCIYALQLYTSFNAVLLI
jgi:hypothetical protein